MSRTNKMIKEVKPVNYINIVDQPKLLKNDHPGSIDEARKLIEENQTIKEIKERTNKPAFKFYLTQIEKTLADFSNKSRKRKAEE
uniref:Uncharacterized protein n=1 Tax=Acrobeloides nanus TaxID=290746 RepID=A0A914D3A3_9BILA